MLVTTQCHASRWSMQLLWLHTLTLLSHSNHELAGESLLCMSGLACCCAWHLPEVNIGIVHCAVCNSLPPLSRGCQTIYHCMLQTHSAWVIFAPGLFHVDTTVGQYSHTVHEWWSKQASKQENIHTHVQCRHKKYASIMSSTYFLSTFFSCIHRTKPK